jgi:hypothetical protein
VRRHWSLAYKSYQSYTLFHLLSSLAKRTPWNREMNNFLRTLSLSKQFLMVSFPILLAATLTIRWRVGQQVEDSVVHRIRG